MIAHEMLVDNGAKLVLNDDVVQKVGPSDAHIQFMPRGQCSHMQVEPTRGYYFGKSSQNPIQKLRYLLKRNEVMLMWGADNPTDTHNYQNMLRNNKRSTDLMSERVANSIRERHVASTRQSLLLDSSHIVDGLLDRNPRFANINKTNFGNTIAQIIRGLPSEVLVTINKEDLEERIERIMLLESMVSAFEDLTPEQMKQLYE